jgi:4-hydroxy-2-oxoglutarate aldolase
MPFHGVFAPICTPFDERGEVHVEALKKNIARYRAAGLNGFVVSGTTGEAPLLSKDEKLRLYEAVREAAEDRLLIAGTASESARETVSLIAAAAELKYAAALVLTPSFYRAQMMKPEVQADFFRAVADEAALPVLIYNLPQMTGIDLPVEVVRMLSEHGNIAGIKESSGEIDKVGRLIFELPKGFDVLIGASPKFHACLCLGATGGILAGANILPRSSQLVYERFRAGDVEGSQALQKKIAEVTGIGARFGIQGVKYAMDRKGLYGGSTRVPLMPLNADQRADLDVMLRDVEDEAVES